MPLTYRRAGPVGVTAPYVMMPGVMVPSVIVPSVIAPSVIAPSVTAPSVIVPSVVLTGVTTSDTLAIPGLLLSHMFGFSPGAETQSPHVVSPQEYSPQE